MIKINPAKNSDFDEAACGKGVGFEIIRTISKALIHKSLDMLMLL